MKEFLPVLRSSVLLSGISEEDLIAMLACLDVKTKSYPKDAFLFRAGDTAESIGLVLSGTVLIIQEDVWGNRNIISKAAPGQTFAAAYACAPVRLRPPQPHYPESAGRTRRKKPAFRRKTHAYRAAHHARKAYVLLLRRSATARQMRIRYSVFQATTRGLSCGRTQRLIALARKNATRRTSGIS